ncbi:hypothetical protein [Desulforhopalus singaporensis]|nr:hypothetical protein [Desulforhopalus singaporensis]
MKNIVVPCLVGRTFVRIETATRSEPEKSVVGSGNDSITFHQYRNYDES